MKLLTYICSLLLLLMPQYTFPTEGGPDLTSGFEQGNPHIKSINAMAFGPEGILFLGDSHHAKIVAMDTEDQVSRGAADRISMKQIDHKIASLVGTTADKLSIQDMAVNPISKTIYIAAHLEDGTPVLVKTSGENLELVSLESASFSVTDLTNPIKADAKDRRGRSQRKWAISDMAYFDGQVMVSGLSNEEFGSTFRSINFPFSDQQKYSTLEIFHAAHGKYETHSPIKTFMPYKLNGEAHILASYTCTPLVIFPLSEMKAGEHTKGKTVAELGNRNTPLDIISYENNGKSYLLMANSSRALMKIDPEKVASYTDFLTEPVKENSAIAGVEFLNMPYVFVTQLDDYNEQAVLMIRRQANGSLDMETVSKRRL
ncbi:MAG: hypothetical protein AAF587_40920 [Bacteroidota bacterium]